MKRITLFAVCLLLLASTSNATEVFISTQGTSFSVDDSGEINPGSYKFGGTAAVTTELSDTLTGKIILDADPFCGKSLAVYGIYRKSFFDVSGGPFFGFLNSTGSSGVPVLFQPGLALGIGINLPGLVILKANSEFALPPAASSGNQVFVQKSELSASFSLPNIITTLKISQKSNTRDESGVTEVRSITDYGMYNEAFQKGAPFRISVDFIYRKIDFYNGTGSIDNREIGNIVLGGGVTWAPHNDMEIFIKGNGSLYSFSLDDTPAGIDTSLVEIQTGVMWRLADREITE